MRRADRLIRVRIGDPLPGIITGFDPHTAFDADRVRVTTGRQCVAAQSIERTDEFIAGRKLRHPTVCEPTRSFEHLLHELPDERTHPDRYWPLDGHGVQPYAIDAMPLPIEGRKFVRPESAQHSELFLEPSAAVREVFVERLVLHPVPPDTDTEAQPTTGQEIELGRLLRQQHGLPLCRNHDRRCEFDSLGDGTEEREKHERLMGRHVVRMYLLPRSLSIGVRTDDVVVRQQRVEANALDRLRHVTQKARVVPDIRVVQHHTESHARNLAVVVGQNGSVIEIATFRIVGGEDAFLELDQRIQTEFAYQQPGLVRRTTAKAEDGEWVVITVWTSAAHASAAAEAWLQHPLQVALRHVIATKSASERRYEALTG
jgi:hypothetical protein